MHKKTNWQSLKTSFLIPLSAVKKYNIQPEQPAKKQTKISHLEKA